MKLPQADGSLIEFSPAATAPYSVEAANWNRCAYAAVHVVADSRAGVNWFDSGTIDWDTTLAYRHHLWQLGFAVAEAMDTAQRGMGPRVAAGPRADSAHGQGVPHARRRRDGGGSGHGSSRPGPPGLAG